MEIKVFSVPEKIIVVKNFFNKEELDLIWKELDVLCSPYVMNVNHTVSTLIDSAKDIDRKPLKSGHGIFIYDFYRVDQQYSDIIRLNKKIFNFDFVETLCVIDRNFNYVKYSNSDNILVNYYEENHNYGKHRDNSVFTFNIALWREPKQFDGGIFSFPDINLELELNSNDMVIFPGYMNHEVSKINMHDDYTPWKSGRYTITTFISFN